MEAITPTVNPAVRLNQALPVSTMVRSTVSGGRVTLPVENFSVYARFKHVQGVPAPRDGAGYSVSRLRVLDTLIDRLAKIKSSRAEAAEPQPAETGLYHSGMSDEAIDALVEQYAAALHSAISRAGSAVFPVAAGLGLAELGAVVDVFA